MDQVILAQKLESLRRCVKRVEDKTPPDIDQLVRDPDLQDILALNSQLRCDQMGNRVCDQSEISC